MAAITDIIVKRVAPNTGLTTVLVQTKNTVDAGDTIDVTLSDYGISPTGLMFVLGNKHTTDGSVIVTEAPTTAVAAGVLTITVPAGTNDDTRVYLLVGYGITPTYA